MGFLIAYLIIMFIWCCAGFVIGYVADEELTGLSFIGVFTGFVWPLSIIGFILIGIGKLILFIKYRE